MTVNRSRSPRHTIARASALAGTALMAAAALLAQPQPATGWNQWAAEATLWQLLNGARINNGRRAVSSTARW